jgi:predicted acyl esterase
MDIFATVRAFAPNGEEVTFQGANDPAAPVTQGWLRVSHRKVDPTRSTPYRPWHSHDEIQKIDPGELYDVDVEIWPTCLVFPAGYRLALTLQGRDFERPSAAIPESPSPVPMRGSGPFLHADPADRDSAEFAGTNTIVSGGDQPSYLLVPVIPPTEERW